MASEIDEKFEPTFPVSDVKDCLFLKKNEQHLENVNTNSIQMPGKLSNSSAVEQVSECQKGYQKEYCQKPGGMGSPKMLILSNSEAEKLKEPEDQRWQNNIEMRSEKDASPETNFMTRNPNMDCFKLQQQIIQLQDLLLKAKNKELNYVKEEKSSIRELAEQVKKMSEVVGELKELVRETRGSKSTTENVEASSISEIDNNEYHLGKGVFVPKDRMERIFCLARSPSAFVGSLAALVFSEQVLVNHSVTGSPCRNVVDAEQLPVLDSKKLGVVFECYKNWLDSNNSNNFSEAEKKSELDKFVLYLNIKRGTLKRKYTVQNGENGIVKKRQLKVKPVKGALKRKALEESINLSQHATQKYFYAPTTSFYTTHFPE